MARLQSLRVAILNVTVHPHPDGVYEKLLSRAIELQQEEQTRGNYLPVRGEKKAMFRSLSRRRSDDLPYLRGSFVRFIDLSPDDDWINLETGSLLDEDDKPGLDESVKPYRNEFSFVLLPTIHRIIIEADHRDGSLSPRLAGQIFELLFSHQKIIKEFGDVTVTVEQSLEGLEKVFSLPRISHLEIVITRPNGDAGGDLDEEFESFLEKANGAKLTARVDAKRTGPGIVPDTPVIEAMSNAALSNGHVTAIGNGKDGEKVEVSTENHPRLEATKFDPDKMSRNTALVKLAKSLMPSFERRARK